MTRFFVEWVKPGVIARFFALDGDRAQVHVHGKWRACGALSKEQLIDRVALGALREIPAMPDSQVVRIAHCVGLEAFGPWLGIASGATDPETYFAPTTTTARGTGVEIVSHVAYGAPFAGHVVCVTRTTLYDLHHASFGSDVSLVSHAVLPAAAKSFEAKGTGIRFEGAGRADASGWLASACVEHARALADQIDAEKRARERAAREQKAREREERERTERERAAREQKEREQKERDERERAERAARGELNDVTDDDLRALLRKRREEAKAKTTNAGG